MTVDDHAIDSLRTWFDLAYEELKKEWKSGQYEKLSDCPSFKAAAAYNEAINVLHKGSNFPEVAEEQLKKALDEELEIENFWKESEQQKGLS
ncbi:hypothetical protein [Cytobacillus firmus]|uniref:Uncharacterized protein n=1 Tax=Cytobacillus firmus DS1 TaxID=1307436 RepID=W7KLX8_CYTFI|nr:hypothetical protein [Cytobacillus firmus]EWG08400.1 hypothetical protein PBF_24398 [Cytobacillus firmus DS1]